MLRTRQSREAIEYYQTAIAKQPDYPDAYYNLGLTLLKQNQWDDAIVIYTKLLALVPEHFAARFHLGCAFMQQEKLNEAIQEFLQVEQAHPNHFETQANLATAYLKSGELSEARTHYAKALELSPNDTQILFNLGVINMQQGFTDRAIQYYQRAVKINPDLFAAHNNLGVAFLGRQHVGYALQHFQEALRLQPNNKTLDYTVKMLCANERLLTAPPDYITSLFDAYADHYEPHLLKALDYKVHELLHQAAVNIIGNDLDILDLGCGTGLCGVQFKPHAKTLTGVDLSQNMLDIAAQKNSYDALIHSDLTAFLSDKKSAYDVVLAGDTLVYIGDLETIFASVHKALRAHGFFIFNTEIEENSTYKMNQSGRFSHQKDYLDNLPKKTTLRLCIMTLL